jgi:hypothetical protein
MAAARLLFHSKRLYGDGAILETKLWQVPTAVPGSTHLLKYRLFYGISGARLIGYDNEAGKGDHRHYGDREEPYLFQGPGRLIADFLADVRRLRGDDI